MAQTEVVGADCATMETLSHKCLVKVFRLQKHKSQEER